MQAIYRCGIVRNIELIWQNLVPCTLSFDAKESIGTILSIVIHSEAKVTTYHGALLTWLIRKSILDASRFVMTR